ncbi:cytochrome P450 [Blastocladiella britannica]|nr:cytochrome P450 [Blastocladiella britannica]
MSAQAAEVLRQLADPGAVPRYLAEVPRSKLIALVVAAVTVLPVLPVLLSHSVDIIKNIFLRRRIVLVRADGTKRSPPGPSTSFWQYLTLGHLGDLMAGNVVPYLVKNQAKYGPVYTMLTMAGRPWIVCADPKVLYAVLSTNAYDFGKPKEDTEFLEVATGSRNVLIMVGDDHKARRRILNPMFNAKLLKGFYPVLEESADEALETIAADPSTPRNIQEFSSALTLNVIGRTMLSTDFDAFGPTTSPLLKAYTDLALLAEFTTWNLLLGMIPILWWLPLPSNIRSWNARNAVFDEVARMISSKRAALQAGKAASDHAPSLADVLVAELERPDSRLSAIDVRDELLVMLAAGHDTSGITVTMTAYYLARYPAVQERLYNEIKGVDSQDLATCEYFNWVINESLRLHSPAYVTSRIATKDLMISMTSGESLHVPKNGVVVIPFQPIHLDPQIWGADATEFRPERWSKIRIAVSAAEVPETGCDAAGNRVLHPYEFFPFSGGPRACIGRQFAMMEIRVLVARLVARFHIRVPAGGELERRGDAGPEVQYGITAHPLRVELTFAPRV